MNRIELGKSLAGLREAAGLTQSQVADHLGVRASSISNWENAIREPTIENVTSFADACGYDMNLDFRSRTGVSGHADSGAVGPTRFAGVALGQLRAANQARVLALVSVIDRVPREALSLLDDLVTGWARRHPPR
jgi:transcriptional regulator with XRE-family HTH domain